MRLPSIQSKTLFRFRRKILIVFITGFILSAIFLFYFIQPGSNPPAENAIVLSEQEQTYDLPVRLKIPGINVDAAVEYVGLTSNGEMGIPKGPSEVGWYELGPRPGENGSAVISGHYGTWKNGQGSVFDNLHKLRAGDKVYVEDGKGAAISFVVRESRSYDPEADASDVFESNDGNSRLNLITCEGTWNKASKSYSQRLVVFTDKE